MFYDLERISLVTSLLLAGEAFEPLSSDPLNSEVVPYLDGEAYGLNPEVLNDEAPRYVLSWSLLAWLSLSGLFLSSRSEVLISAPPRVGNCGLRASINSS